MRWWLRTCLVTTLLLSGPSVWAATYAIDKDHSTVSFRVRHLFAYVQGNFNEFQGTIEYLPGQPEQWKAQATIQAASVDTNVAKRDEHLRTADFFDAATHPAIGFVSTKVTDATATGAKLHGLLTIRGVQLPVVLDVVIHGEGTDPWGNVRAGFTATTKLNRRDFGLTWNQALETGQLLVGEEVEITLEIEGLKQS